MKPEFRSMINDQNDIFYKQAMKALVENNYWHNVKIGDVIAITHFTHPLRVAKINEFIEIFEEL